MANSIPTKIDGLCVIEFSHDLGDHCFAICFEPTTNTFRTLICDHQWSPQKTFSATTLMDARCVPLQKLGVEPEWQAASIAEERQIGLAQKYFTISLFTAFGLSVLQLFIGDSMLSSVIASCCVFVAIVSAVAIWILVGIIGFKNRGSLYAVTHVTLTALLTPVFFCGLFLLPAVVLGDARRLHEWDFNEGLEPVQ